MIFLIFRQLEHDFDGILGTATLIAPDTILTAAHVQKIRRKIRYFT